MDTKPAASAVNRLRRNDLVVQNILTRLSPSDIVSSRCMSAKFNRYGRLEIPRIVDSCEWQARLQERLGPSAIPESANQYYDASRSSTVRDENVFAMTMSPGIGPYTLDQTLLVYPNMETFYTDGAIIDRISDRLWIIRSDLRESATRTALIRSLNSGFFNDEALSHCPLVAHGSKLSLRNTHRLNRLKKTSDMKGSRYYRFTTVSPAHGPRYLLGEDSASVYNIAAFTRLIDAHASNAWGPAHSIETIEYAPRTDYRLSAYRRLALQQFPVSCHGNTTVVISSPSRAPGYFDLMSNGGFPGNLRSMKHLVIDASIGTAPRSVPNVAEAYSSPHLESVMFRLQGMPEDEAAMTSGSYQATVTPGIGTDETRLARPEDLARPLVGSAAKVTFVSAEGRTTL
jgi:hypothetical protein